jgi:hypothetical protein
MTAHELSAGYPPSFPFVCPYWVGPCEPRAGGWTVRALPLDGICWSSSEPTIEHIEAREEKDVCAAQVGEYLDTGKLARGSSNGAVPKKRARDP